MVSNARSKQKMWDVLLNTLTSETITSILPLWDSGSQSFMLVSQGINAVYKFQSQSNVLYLRVTHEKLRKFSELENFVWFIRLKALNMYLWTKYNWSSDIAPGGASTKKWLSLLYRMIENQSWKSELNHLIGLQMIN